MPNVFDRLASALADRYKVEGEIGRGGMATVYLARDLKHERNVAIKVLQPELAAALGADRFLREIKITANLNHPHILPLLDSGEADSLVFYVMPYVEGESLRDRLNREKQLPIPEALKITGEVADALGFAHEHNIIHRDVKPENILLEGKHAVVADFGIARAIKQAEEPSLTETGIAIGTPAYLSPEQASGERELDGRSDVYSLGCVLYEMLAGEPPVSDTSAPRVVSRKLLGQFRPVNELCPEATPAVIDAVTRALATEPAERFGTAGEFVEALTSSAAVDQGRTGKRPWPRWAAGAAAAASVVIGLSWYLAGTGFLGPVVGTSEALIADRVAVLPFTVRGDEELATLEAGMAELLATALDGAGELATVDPRAVISFAESETSGPLDPEIGREVAARFGAGRYILGDILSAGGQIRASASLYDSRGEAQTSAAAAVDDEARIFELVDEVARQIALAISDSAGDQLTQIGAATTHSLTALKAYLKGEALLRSALFNPAGARSAVAEYRKAVAADTAFALAYFRMAYIQSTNPADLDVGDAAERALQFADRLAPREERLLECFVALERGDGEEAERVCREVLARDERNADAWFMVGEALHHYGLRRGRTLAEVRGAYDRAIALEPSHLYNILLSHRAWLARVEEDFAAWAEYSERAVDVQPQHPASRLIRLALDAWRGEDTALDQFVTILADEPTSAEGVWLSSWWTWPLENRVATIRVLRTITSPDRSRADRAFGQVVIAHEELAAGRLAAARAELAEAQLDLDSSLTSKVYLLLSPYLPITADDFSALRDEVAGWNPVEPSHRVWRLYLLGLLSERLSDVTEAARLASELDLFADSTTTEDGTDSVALAEDLALYLRARLAAGAGRYEEALRLLDQTEPQRWWPVMSGRAYLKQLYERWLTAEVLVALGRHEDALHWLAGFGMDGERSYMGIRHIRMAEIHEELGNREKARYHYGRFITYWKDADPELQPRVEAARRAIQALSTDR